MKPLVGRRVTQRIVAFAAMAAAGSGVYYLTKASNVTPLAETNSIESVESRPLRRDQPGPSASLDAVASAWHDDGARKFVPAGPIPVAAAVPNSATRLDAAVSEFDGQTATAPPLKQVDRYAIPEPAQQEVAEEAVALDDEIARGQEPGAEPDVQESPTPSDQPADLEVFDRARAAFRDSRTDDKAGRYGGASSARTAVSDVPGGALPLSEPNELNLGQPAAVPTVAKGARPIDARQQNSASLLPAQPGTTSGGSFTLSDQPASIPAAPAASAPPAARFQLPASPGQSAGASYPSDQFSGNLSGPASGTPVDGDGGSAGIDGRGKPGEQTLEGPQQPSLVVEKFAPAEIQIGKPATFRTVVRNVSGRPAEAVLVRDEIPQGTRLVSTSPRGEEASGEVVWRLGVLSPGDERQVEMQLMPTAEGEIGSVATVSFATQASVKTRSTRPQLAVRMTAPRQVMRGREHRVKIEMHNPGTGDATGVMLFENVPPELRHQAGQTLEFEVGTLRAGETRQLELLLMAEKPGLVTNRVTARADGNLQVEQQVEFEVIAPDLQVNVQGPSLRYLERQATYEVSVDNPGTATARDIELVTRLPHGLKFVRANNLGEYDATTHSVFWSLAELPEGERGTVELVAMPVESGEHTIRVEGRGQEGLEDEAAKEIVIEGLAALMFEVVDVEDPIEVGGETTYEIRVVNEGSKEATNVEVRATLPPGLQAISANGETGHAIQAQGVVFEPLNSLSPKSESVYRIQVQGVRAGDQRVSVEVNSDDFTQPIRKEENTRVFGDQ